MDTVRLLVGGRCPEPHANLLWRATVAVGEARRRLDPEPIINRLSPDAVYESQDVFEALEGRDTIAAYLRKRFAFFRELAATGRDTGQISYGTVGCRWSDHPCVILSPSNGTPGLWLLTLAEDGTIARVDIITVVPDPWSALPCEPPLAQLQ